MLIDHDEREPLDTEAARQQAVRALGSVGQLPPKANQEQKLAILHKQVARTIPALAQLVDDLANEVDAVRAERDLERRAGEERAAFDLEHAQRLIAEREAAVAQLAGYEAAGADDDVIRNVEELLAGFAVYDKGGDAWAGGPDRPRLLIVAEERDQVAALLALAKRLLVAKDGAYAERNRLVAALARLAPALGWTAGLARTAIEGWEPEWHNCVYVDTPAGQLSWHYHDREAALFAGIPPYAGAWDGHSTDEKYARLADAAGTAAEMRDELGFLCDELSADAADFRFALVTLLRAGAVPSPEIASRCARALAEYERDADLSARVRTRLDQLGVRVLNPEATVAAGEGEPDA